VKQGISVYSSWVDEANTALTFYQKPGEKDRKGNVVSLSGAEGNDRLKKPHH